MRWRLVYKTLSEPSCIWQVYHSPVARPGNGTAGNTHSQHSPRAGCGWAEGAATRAEPCCHLFSGFASDNAHPLPHLPPAISILLLRELMQKFFFFFKQVLLSGPQGFKSLVILTLPHFCRCSYWYNWSSSACRSSSARKFQQKSAPGRGCCVNSAFSAGVCMKPYLHLHCHREGMGQEHQQWQFVSFNENGQCRFLAQCFSVNCIISARTLHISKHQCQSSVLL